MWQTAARCLLPRPRVLERHCATAAPDGVCSQEWRNPAPAAVTPSYTEKLLLQLQQLAADFKYNLKV